MPALLGEFLILELDRGGARLFVTAHGVPDVEQASVAGVTVGDQRRRGLRRHGFDAPDHVGIGREPRVGQAHVRRDRPVAGHVESVEAELVCAAQRHHVEHAGRDEELLLAEALAQVWGGHDEVSRYGIW